MHPVASAQWLAQLLDDRDVVIIDCRFSLMQPDLGLQAYQASHIPNAYYLDLNRDLSGAEQAHGGRHPLPDLTTLSQTLASFGIHRQETLVVVYDASRFAFASRLWWLLRYLGHDRVVVLDGGWQHWSEAGYPTTAELPVNRTGRFAAQVRSHWAVKIDQVKIRKELPDVVLIDARDRDRYRGEREPIDPVAGHIPGALNYPWKAVSNEQGLLLPVEQQQQQWQSLQGKNEAIVYCGSGVTACVNLLSLELAGYPLGDFGKLYPGSWSDWCSYL